MKKIALKGLAVLGIVVLLCLFFSGTLHTLTTAKVRVAKAKTGKLETSLALTGNLFWPDTENIRADHLSAADALTVVQLQVSPGSYVKTGDPILQCELNEYDSRLETLQSNYQAKEQEYLEQERKHSGLLISEQQRNWFNAWQQVKSARRETEQLRQELRLAAWQAGIILNADDTLPDNAAEENLLAAADQLRRSEEAETSAREAFSRVSRLSISEEVLSYLEKKSQLEEDLENISEKITALRILRESCTSVSAPHDGYIVTTDVKAGDTITRTTPVGTMTAAEVSPVIRLAIPKDKNSQRSISPGTDVELSVNGKTLTRPAFGITVSTGGEIYAEVPLIAGDIAMLGGTAVLSESGTVSGKVTLQSENITTLIPLSALRGSEGSYYIFTASIETDAMGGEKMNVVKKNVTVLGKSATTVSVSENLLNDSILYMEDRVIYEGREVMLYSNGK